MPSEIVAKPRGAGAPTGAARWAAVPMVVLAAVLALLATQGLIYALVAIAMSAYLVAVLVFGMTRVGIATLMACMATAPEYKGLVPSMGTVTPTDLLMVMGFGLLLPRIVQGRFHAPVPYLVGTSVVAISGLIATVLSASMLESAFGLTFWLLVIVGLPTAVVLWAPGQRTIRLLAWSYIVGHMLSWAAGTALHHVVNGRYYGLTNHPNYFAEAGLLAVALLIYLYFSYDSWRPRVVVLGFGALSLLSILLSGSRGATVVVAVLVLMIPIVERSAIAGFLWAVAGAALVGLAPFLLNVTGNTAAIQRLLGNGSAQGSDQVRSEGLHSGLQMVREKPVFGRGLVSADLFNIHNNYLEVAVAIGVVGLVGYLLVLFAFARPLFENHVHRRLCYTVWAYIGWGATVPALYDRSIWLPMMLAALCWIRPTPDDGMAGEQHTSGAALPAAATTGRS